MVNCKICEKEFDLDKQLHSHLRAHKLRMAEYYQTHFPRYDVYDKKIIKFKNKKQYFESDFNSRTNLRLWLKSITEEEALQMIADAPAKKGRGRFAKKSKAKTTKKKTSRSKS